MFALSLLIACSDPVVAPQEVSELTLWFYEQWSEDDPASLEAAVAALLEHAETLDFQAGWSERSYEINALDPAVLEGKVEHDRDVSLALGVGVIHHPTWPLADFLALQALADQTPVEPTSPDHYVREVTEGDPCFFQQTCDVLRTANNMTRSNALYAVTYDLPKEFRWVPVGEDERAAFSARSWMPESAHDGDKISLWQGYSADVWIPLDDGTLRYQISWQETEIPGLDWDNIVGIVAAGIDDMFQTQDAYLQEQTDGE